MPRKYSKTFSPAELSQPQIINNMEIFKSFPHAELSQPQFINNLEIVNEIFTGRNICLKLSTTWKHSNFFSPAEMSQPQIIIIPKNLKGFFACRILLHADHQQPGNFQRFFRVQNCLSRRSSMPRKYSKTFSPAELSQPQIINNLEKVRNIFACKSVSAANHQYPENIHRLFRLQNCLGRRSSIPRKYSKTFSPAELSQPQIINNMEIFKSFPHAELSQPQIINNLEIVNEIFTGRNISVSNYQQHGNIQCFFRLQFCFRRKSSLSRKNSKIFSLAKLSYPQIIDTPKIFKQFFTCRYVLVAKHQKPENIQRLFRLQNCLCRRSSLSRKHSKIFSPAEFSQTQIINNLELEIIKDFFACRFDLAAGHRYPEKIQRFFHLQNCLSRN